MKQLSYPVFHLFDVWGKAFSTVAYLSTTAGPVRSQMTSSSNFICQVIIRLQGGIKHSSWQYQYQQIPEAQSVRVLMTTCLMQRLYGLKYIRHTLLQQIVSISGSLTYKLARHLTNLLPFIGGTYESVSESKHFI